MHFSNRRFRSGFTLVELLIVVIIIATLAALGFSVIKRIRERANNVVALANMRQIGTGIGMYMSDNDRLPRFSGTGVSPILSTDSKYERAHANVLQSYLGLAEPSSQLQYAEIFRPVGIRSDNMAGKKNWYDVTAYAMYSTNDVHKTKAYFPKGTFADSTGADVGPFGRTGTGGNPSSDGWKSAYFDKALAKYAADNGGQSAGISMVPAMMEINATQKAWPWPVPQKPVRGDHVNVLYFDWHADSVKPDFFYKP